MICKDCGKEYEGHHRSKWCVECRLIRTSDNLPCTILDASLCGTLCGRRAVSYGDNFESRPEPFGVGDIPDKSHRLRYHDSDGLYLIKNGVRCIVSVT